MTAPATTRSAYPAAVEELIPQAQRLAESLDRPLSRNLLMKEFRIGSPKATAVLEALAATPVPHAADPPAPPPDTVPAETDDTGPVAEHPLPVRAPVTWPVLILCLPAFVAIWGGWVEMGRLTGFGVVKLLPGIADSVQLNTAITLPIGVETYAAYALYVWLSGRATGEARVFAKWSALASLGLGAAGQIAYHLMAAAGWTSAPWPITAAVACIPVAVLGMGAALAHLMHTNHQ